MLEVLPSVARETSSRKDSADTCRPRPPSIFQGPSILSTRPRRGSKVSPRVQHKSTCPYPELQTRALHFASRRRLLCPLIIPPRPWHLPRTDVSASRPGPTILLLPGSTIPFPPTSPSWPLPILETPRAPNPGRSNRLSFPSHFFIAAGTSASKPSSTPFPHTSVSLHSTALVSVSSARDC